MKAVEQMKMQREKFEIDKKVSNLQMDKLGLELDPETHAQQKKLNDMKMKSMQTIMDYQEAKIKEIHSKTTQNLGDYTKLMHGYGLAFEDFKKLSPGLADQASFSAPIGAGKLTLGQPKKGNEVDDIISSVLGGEEKVGTEDTATPDGIPDYESMEEEKLFQLAESGDEEAQKIGFKLYGGQ